MITLDDIRKKTRTLSASAFGDTFNFQQRLCVMDRDGEKRMRELMILAEKVDRINADDSLTPEEKYGQVEELGANERSALEEQICLAVASWEIKVHREDKEFIAVSRESLREHDVPLEIYLAVLRAIRDNPLVPNPT